MGFKLIPRPYKDRIKQIRQSVLHQLGYLSKRYLEAHDSLLIVSPHPDDEVLGCGGLLAKYCAPGKKAYVLFLTRGEASHTKCCGASKALIGTARRKLAVEAHASMGASPDRLYFLNGKDGQLPRSGGKQFFEFTDRIAQHIELLRPEAVFCPHPFEVFNDHVAGEELARAALGKLSYRPALFYYCVWFWYTMPLHKAIHLRWRDARLLDITGQMPAKSRAIDTYLGRNAPCGAPLVGGLPQAFLKAFYWKKELFFKVPTTKS